MENRRLDTLFRQWARAKAIGDHLGEVFLVQRIWKMMVSDFLEASPS